MAKQQTPPLNEHDEEVARLSREICSVEEQSPPSIMTPLGPITHGQEIIAIIIEETEGKLLNAQEQSIAADKKWQEKNQ